MSIFERLKAGIRIPPYETKVAGNFERGRAVPLTETKSAGSGTFADLHRGFERINEAFDEFKAKNDRQIAELKRGRPDPLTVEQVDRINKDIDALKHTYDQEILALKRSTILSRMADGGEYKSAAAIEYENAFAKYLRKGGNAAELDLERIGETVPELKALSVGSDPAGGFTVLPQIEQTMVEL